MERIIDEFRENPLYELEIRTKLPNNKKDDLRNFIASLSEIEGIKILPIEETINLIAKSGASGRAVEGASGGFRQDKIGESRQNKIGEFRQNKIGEICQEKIHGEIRHEIMQFPFKKLLYSIDEVVEKFNNLRNYNYVDRLYYEPYQLRRINLNPTFGDSHKYIRIKSLESDYEDFNILSDLFQEDQRLKCLVYTEKITPYDYYFENYDKVKQLAKTKPDSSRNLTNSQQQIYKMREALFDLTRECSSFRPNIICTFIQMFGSKSVLDFSAGWGDRLIGALCMNVKYVGIDPNSGNHPNYNDMIKFYNENVKKINLDDYIMIDSTIEDAVIPNRKYDLIFTSPPYFDLELYDLNLVDSTGIYETNPKQSSKYNNEYLWFNNFLKVALKKVYSKLSVNGYMVININQKDKKESYVSKMIEFMENELPNGKYMGVISYTNERHTENPQPSFIYKKLASKSDNEVSGNVEIIIGKSEGNESLNSVQQNKCSYTKLFDELDKIEIPQEEINELGFTHLIKLNIDKYVETQPIKNVIMTLDEIKYYSKFNRMVVKMNRPNLHVGQRKLFLCELQFLTNQLKSFKDKAYVVYAGAAAANSRYELGKLFPNVKFIFVDPAEFKIYINEFGKSSWRFPRHHEIHKRICYIRSAYGDDKNKQGGWSNDKNKKFIFKKTYNVEDFENFYEQNTNLPKSSLKEEDTNYLKSDLSKFIEETNFQFYIIEDLYRTELSLNLRKLTEKANASNIPMFFWSDIRTADDHPTDLDVVWNSAQQYIWAYELRCNTAMFKFRTPYMEECNEFNKDYDKPMYMDIFNYCKEKKKNGEIFPDFLENQLNVKFEYCDGTIYLQTREGRSSTETRLVTNFFDIKSGKLNKDFKIKNYDHLIFDWTGMFYNTMIRPYQMFSYLESDISEEKLKELSPGFDYCSDCAIEYTIWKNYFKFYNLTGEKLDEICLRSTNIMTNITGRSLLQNGHGHLYPSEFAITQQARDEVDKLIEVAELELTQVQMSESGVILSRPKVFEIEKNNSQILELEDVQKQNPRGIGENQTEEKNNYDREKLYALKSYYNNFNNYGLIESAKYMNAKINAYDPIKNKKPMTALTISKEQLGGEEKKEKIFIGKHLESHDKIAEIAKSLNMEIVNSWEDADIIFKANYEGLDRVL